MSRPAKFSHSDIVDATARLAARDGPARATMASIAAELRAPTGSLYHRFASRDILLGEVVPLLDLIERFLRVEGLALLRPGLPVRAAILQVASAIILRSASGALQQPLWGPIDHARALARLLLFKEV